MTLKILGGKYFAVAASLAVATSAYGVQLDAKREGNTRVRERLLEVIAESRGVVGDPQAIAFRDIESGVGELGTEAVPVALELLRSESLEPAVQAGLLMGVVRITGMQDEQVCGAIRQFLQRPLMDPIPELMSAALVSLRSREGGCSVVPELVAVWRRAESSTLRFEVAEVLGWVGEDTEDLLLVQKLAGEAENECDRRLLSAAVQRILDRLYAGGLIQATPDRLLGRN